MDRRGETQGKLKTKTAGKRPLRHDVRAGIHRDLVLWSVLAAVLFLFVFIQVRGEHVADIDVTKTAEKLLKVMNEDVKQEDTMAFKKRYNLNPEDYKKIIYYGPVSNMNAEEFLLVEMSDESQKEGLQAAIDGRIATQKKSFDGYGVDQLALIKKAEVVIKGRYAMFVISKHAASVEETYGRIIRTGRIA